SNLVKDCHRYCVQSSMPAGNRCLAKLTARETDREAFCLVQKELWIPGLDRLNHLAIGAAERGNTLHSDLARSMQKVFPETGFVLRYIGKKLVYGRGELNRTMGIRAG